MKKFIKTAAALMCAAFVLAIVGCSYEAGYSTEAPVTQQNPGPASSGVKTISTGVSTPSIPSGTDDGDDDLGGGSDDYSLIYQGSTVDTLSSEELFFMLAFFEEGTDYVIDYTNKTVTFTEAGFTKAQNLFGSGEF
jgi:hypothetical protein